MKEKKIKPIQFMASINEKKRIESNAKLCGMSLSHYCRWRSLTPPDIPFSRKFVSTLKKAFEEEDKNG